MGQVLSPTWTPTPTPCCVGFPFGINIFPFTVTATTISGNHTNTEPIFICLSIKMPLNCSSLVTQRPFIRTTRRLLTPHHGKFHTFSFLFNCQHITRNTQYKNKTPHSVSLSKFDTNYSVSSSIMEEQQQGNLSLDKSLEAKYSEELDVAVRAVQMACFLCQKVQENLISKSSNQVHSKDDNSPVTVADWSVQAIVSWLLSESFGSKNVSIVAEEDVQSLSTAEAAGLLEAVVKTVNNCLVEAPRFGFQGPVIPLRTSEVLEAISRCNSNGGPEGRFWALDPVDGTLGFVRGDQYAIALALIENGEPVVGVLGCPNYPMRKEWLSYHHRYHRIISKLTPLTSESWDKGCVMYARRGSGGAWIQPLILGNKKLVLLNSARPVKVSSIENPALATFCEPVEKSNSSHSFTAGLAHSVGLRKQPLRVYSMVKYAAIARGDAEIFMKFARCGYKEKIWDHAAGVVIIEEAGGVVTDAGGHPLDFSRGIYVEGLDRGIIACAGAKLHEKIISAVDASWDSSSL